MLREHFKKINGEEAFDLPEKEQDRAAEPAVPGSMTEAEVPQEKPRVPDGMFQKCESCKRILYEEDVRENWYCCPECGKHFRIGPRERMTLTADSGSFEEWDGGLTGTDPLQFPGYAEKLKALQEKTGLEDAVITGRCTIRGIDTAIGVMSPDFLMGSMGTVVGERITRMIERATRERLPVILFCCSGGARMQEGIFSLMQMAKTSQALRRHDGAGLLYVPVLTDPTTGGVTASFAMLGDVILAEPGALIGFAGARVIRQTIGQKLPEGFQSAEFLLKHGFVDRIVRREQMRRTLATILRSSMKLTADRTVPGSRTGEPEEHTDCVADAPDRGPEHSGPRTAWERVRMARSSDRLFTADYLAGIFDGFLELRGDRLFGDDRAVIGGLAVLDGQYVTVIGQQKGRNRKENKYRNFGMPGPEGYRKAVRLMRQAEKFGRPVILFVDTPGAFCGVEAEERGQGEAIARSLFELAGLTVPVLSVVIGEGGSGGALAFAAANEVWMMENAVYSVLSPEGFAAILWKDGKRAAEAAEVMRMTAAELRDAGIVEKVIPEPEPAGKGDRNALMNMLRREIRLFLERFRRMSGTQIAEARYRRFRRIGAVQETREEKSAEES